jgi:hypothetical protein
MIIEHLGDELLVYDQQEHRAYVVPAKYARVVGRRRALKALLAAGIVVAISAPTVAQAASCLTVCGFGDHGKPCRIDGTCGGVCRAPGFCR